MATQTPQRANATARATLVQAEQYVRVALDASARVGGRALQSLGRIFSGRWPLAAAVVVVAVAIWLLATRAPAALLFIGQVVVIVATLLATLAALLWALARPRLRWSPPDDAHESARSEPGGSPEADEAARRITALLRGVKDANAAIGEISRGLLLVGPDGMGKRELARRISVESGAPLGYVSAASFHTSALGLDAWAIRGVFRAARRQARSHGASILYLDHLDLLSAGARAELSAQLDAPTSSSVAPTLTIGATPARAALDPALLRCGRFDLQIELAAPDDAQRAEVIARALSQTSHDDALPLARLVTDMRGYTAAEIKRAINEALALAHTAGRARATAQDFAAACAAHARAHGDVAPVPANALSATEKRRRAYAEAGHVVALAALAPQEPVAHLTIRARREPHPDTRMLESRSAEEIFAAMQIALASRAAQEVFLQARLTNAADDLAEATALALGAVARWGQGDSLIATPPTQSDERLLADPTVREPVERLLRRAYEATRALLERRRAEVIALAETLAEREDLDGAEVAELLRTANSPSPGRLSALNSVAEATLFGTPVAPDFQTPAPHVIGPVAPTAPATSAPQPAGGAKPRVSRASGPSAFAASPSQELRADRVIDRALLRAPLHSRGARRTDPNLPAVSKGASGAANGASNSATNGASGANGGSGG